MDKSIATGDAKFFFGDSETPIRIAFKGYETDIPAEQLKLNLGIKLEAKRIEIEMLKSQIESLEADKAAMETVIARITNEDFIMKVPEHYPEYTRTYEYTKGCEKPKQTAQYYD